MGVLPPLHAHPYLHTRHLHCRAALELFGCSMDAFSAPQQPATAPAGSGDASSRAAQAWGAANHSWLELQGTREVVVSSGSSRGGCSGGGSGDGSSNPLPGFLPLPPAVQSLTACVRPVAVRVAGHPRRLLLLQALAVQPSAAALRGSQQGCSCSCGSMGVATMPAAALRGPAYGSAAAAVSDSLEQQRRQRLTMMCDHHPMFQFLFDAQGRLLAANHSAVDNMRGAWRALARGAAWLHGAAAAMLCWRSSSLCRGGSHATVHRAIGH